MTKSNQAMLFVKLEDQAKNIEVVVFPRLVEQSGPLFTVNKVLAIDGFINYKDGDPKIIAESVWELNEKANLPAFAARKRGQRGGNGNGYNGVKQNPNDKYQLSNQIQSSKSQTENNGTMGQWDNGSKSESPALKIHQPLIITIPSGSEKHILVEIREVLEAFPGESSVTIKIPNNGHSREIRTRTKVETTSALKTRLAKIVGRENVVVE
jgi:DNA polymerase III alpha subunit